MAIGNATRRQAAFTLIETMVVLAMIAIMAAIAVPSFTSFISNYRATSAINDFLQGVTQTRTEALKRGRSVAMAPILGDWRNGWTIFIDLAPTPVPTGYMPVYNGTEELIFQHDPLPSSITISGANANPLPFNGANYVAFDGTGYPRIIGGAGSALMGGIVMTDVIRSTTSRRTLCLAAMGRPRIVRDAVETCVSG